MVWCFFLNILDRKDTFIAASSMPISHPLENVWFVHLPARPNLLQFWKLQHVREFDKVRQSPDVEALKLWKGRSGGFLFWFGGILGSASGAESPVSLSNHTGSTPRLLYSSTHHSSENFTHLKTGWAQDAWLQWSYRNSGISILTSVDDAGQVVFFNWHFCWSKINLIRYKVF